MIDDVKLLDAPNNDLKLTYAISYDYTVYPLSQLDTIYYAARVLNTGKVAQPNTRARIAVKSGASIVFADSTPLGVTLPYNIDTPLFGTNFYVPAPTVGAYAVNTYAFSDSTDAFPFDNSDSSGFNINDSIYAIDNGIYGGAYYTLRGATSTVYEWVNLFRVVHADTLTSIISSFAGGTGNTPVGAVVKAKVYSIDPATFAATQVLASYPRTLAAGDFGATASTLKPLVMRIDSTTGNRILQPGYYMASVQGVSSSGDIIIQSTTKKAAGSLSGFFDATSTNGTPFSFFNDINMYIRMAFGHVYQAPAALSASATATPTTCGQSNGTATATVVGCSGTPTYNWSSTPAQTTATATNLPAGTYTVTVSCSGNSVTASATVAGSTGVTASATSTPTTCGLSNGSATVTATGSGTLNYSWSTVPAQTTATINNIASGNYTVTVSNGTCSATATTSVAASTGISATATATSSTCGAATGTATAVPSGTCSTGFTYTWNTSPAQTTVTATNLPAGIYTVTVSCGGCAATASATVTNPGAPTATVTGTNPACAGAATGSATVTAVGPVTYTWNTTPVQTTATATGLMAGTYTVTVAANGCQTILQVTLVDPARIIATATSALPATCGGANGSATATASGGTGTLTYAWNTTPAQTTATATGLAAGNYTVTVSDANGCSVTATATVAGPAALTAAASVSGTTATVTATGGTPTYTYAWSTTPVQTTATAIGLVPGSYTVTVTDSRTCTATATVTILGIESLDGGVADFRVYPNPSNGNFTASIKLTTTSDIAITVLDIAGRKVYESADKSVKELNKPINLSHMASGSYIINVRTDKGAVNQRIVIQ